MNELKNRIDGVIEEVHDQFEDIQEKINNADISLRGILEDDRAQILSALDSLERARQEADTIRPKVINIENNEGADFSSQNVGTDSQDFDNLNVLNNKIGKGGSQRIGVYSHESQSNQAMEHNVTRRLELLLQAQQSPSQNANSIGDLQSIRQSLPAGNLQELGSHMLMYGVNPTIQQSLVHLTREGLVNYGGFSDASRENQGQ